MNLNFVKLVNPTAEVAEAFTRWENDPKLIYLMRPNRNQADLEKNITITIDELTLRLKHEEIYLIYMDKQLIGEMDYKIDPTHLFKKETNTAWVGITIGEDSARGKGIGLQAMEYLEAQIKEQGCPRIELGVFEFNTTARKLYEKAGYKEIGKISNFTFWQDQMWTDIRMEKYL